MGTHLWENTTTDSATDTDIATRRTAFQIAFTDEPAQEILTDVAVFLNLPPDTPPDFVWMLAEVYDIAVEKVQRNGAIDIQ